MQAEGDVQVTPFRPLDAAPEGLGRGSMLQFVPFHCSPRFTGVSKGGSKLCLESPTATQAEGEAHATPLRKLTCAPAGLGVRWIRQVVPFHRSARGTKLPELAIDAPTAVQDEVEVHDTPFRTLNCAPAGWGLRWIRQVVPFHRSATVTWTPEPVMKAPTAVQAEGEAHDTPFRTLTCAPAGWGVRWIRQVVPFHRSASVTGTPELFTKTPTAVQAEGEAHDTPFRKLPRAPAGLGVRWIRQVVPFHRSARVTRTPEPVVDTPTAMQAEAVVQETPENALTAAPEGLGVGWMLHFLPFQRSASVTPRPEGFTYVPTAVQAEAPEQDAPKSWPAGAAGFGLGTLDQPVSPAIAGVARAQATSAAPAAATSLIMAPPCPEADL